MSILIKLRNSNKLYCKVIKRKLITVVIVKYELLNDFTKNTILFILCLIFRERINKYFKNVFRD